MKSAYDRAKEFFPNGPQIMVDALALSFKEHARDQRHMCAETLTDAQREVNAIGRVQFKMKPEKIRMMETIVDAITINYHSFVMNTKAPGTL